MLFGTFDGINFITGSREGCIYPVDILFFKTGEKRNKGIPSPYAVCFPETGVQGKNHMDIIDFNDAAYDPGKQARGIHQSNI